MITELIRKVVAPVSTNEDDQRREFLLNIILVGSMVLALVATTDNLMDLIRLGSAYRGVHPARIFIFFLFFLSLYVASKNRLAREAAYALVTLYFFAATYSIFAWGIDLPQGLLAYALVIVISGILIGRRGVIGAGISTICLLLLLAMFQDGGITHPNLYWKRESFHIDDAFVLSATLFVITAISWLASREIEKSLMRARQSELDLKKERDQLEVKVEERTQELKRTQLEKMISLYHFAEFGRRASGFFHDVINPLNVVLLNLEQIQTGQINSTDSTTSVRRAIESTKRIEQFIHTAQDQIRRQSEESNFSVQAAIEQSVQLMEYKARQTGVTITIGTIDKRLMLHNDPVKFNQLITNVISNAIDAYQTCDRPEKVVHIEAHQDNQQLIITITDSGCGIAKENMLKIFEPLFTTKTAGRGIGLGLSIVKEIIEKDFAGTITVTSEVDQGSAFVITIPLSNSSTKHP